MPKIVSVASGKGGVGKSITVSNLGIALAGLGRKVVIADFDLGGGNLDTLFGAFEAGPSLDRFLNREIGSLGEAARPIRSNLSLISGAGESFATANPNWAMKKRLLRQVRELDADLVLLDVGAGAGSHALDFFCAGDVRIVVTLPEPTASVDAYRFLKLAAVRESASRISSRNPARRRLEKSDPDRLQEVWETLRVEEIDHPEDTTPCVILNQATASRQSFERLRAVTRQFLGRDLELLGEVPADPAVRASVNQFLPVFEGEPSSPASKSFRLIASALDEKVRRISKTPTSEGPALPDLGSLIGEAGMTPR